MSIGLLSYAEFSHAFCFFLNRGLNSCAILLEQRGQIIYRSVAFVCMKLAMPSVLQFLGLFYPPALKSQLFSPNAITVIILPPATAAPCISACLTQSTARLAAGKTPVIYSSSEKPASPRSSCFAKRQTYHLDAAAMGALERQEDKSTAHASSGPISVCVVCCFIQACSRAKSSWLNATRRQY